MQRLGSLFVLVLLAATAAAIDIADLKDDDSSNSTDSSSNASAPITDTQKSDLHLDTKLVQEPEEASASTSESTSSSSGKAEGGETDAEAKKAKKIDLLRNSPPGNASTENQHTAEEEKTDVSTTLLPTTTTAPAQPAIKFEIPNTKSSNASAEAGKKSPADASSPDESKPTDTTQSTPTASTAGLGDKRKNKVKKLGPVINLREEKTEATERVELGPPLFFEPGSNVPHTGNKPANENADSVQSTGAPAAASTKKVNLRIPVNAGKVDGPRTPEETTTSEAPVTTRPSKVELGFVERSLMKIGVRTHDCHTDEDCYLRGKTRCVFKFFSLFASCE